MKQWRHIVPYLVLVAGLALAGKFYTDHRNDTLRNALRASCERGNLARAEVSARQTAFVALFNAAISDRIQHGQPREAVRLAEVSATVRPLPLVDCVKAIR